MKLLKLFHRFDDGFLCRLQGPLRLRRLDFLIGKVNITAQYLMQPLKAVWQRFSNSHILRFFFKIDQQLVAQPAKMQHRPFEGQIFYRFRVLAHQGQGQLTLNKIFMKRILRNALRQHSLHPAVLWREKQADADVAAYAQQQTQPPERAVHKKQQKNEGRADAGDEFFDHNGLNAIPPRRRGHVRDLSGDIANEVLDVPSLVMDIPDLILDIQDDVWNLPIDVLNIHANVSDVSKLIGNVPDEILDLAGEISDIPKFASNQVERAANFLHFFDQVRIKAASVPSRFQHCIFF